MASRYVCLGLLLAGLIGIEALEAGQARKGVSVDFSHGALKVSENGRHLVHADGTPFFYLGDTAWELFHRLKREEAETYLENRREKGFTVIQAVALAELDGLNTPNPYGHTPLINNDPTHPNDAYFEHVDFIVEIARQKGLYLGLLPTWGDKVNIASWDKSPTLFTKESAYAYGKYIGARYKQHQNIIWILGGDRVATGKEDVFRAMARGIRESGCLQLMTYHPTSNYSSSNWFHQDPWLDFNMMQSGHTRFDLPNYLLIEKDYALQPAKPCMDAEPRYENHPVRWKPENGWFMEFDTRQAAYWSLFAGSCGHTYGCHDIWQMMAPGRGPRGKPRNYWYEVMDLPGAWSMMHMRHLMESRPMLCRIPDQSLLVSGQQEGGRHIRATRGDGYIMVYTPYGDPFEINPKTLSAESIRAWWFDPRTGQATLIDTFSGQEQHQFDPPGESKRGNDWILVLDDLHKNYPSPGTVCPSQQGKSDTTRGTDTHKTPIP